MGGALRAAVAVEIGPDVSGYRDPSGPEYPLITGAAYEAYSGARTEEEAEYAFAVWRSAWGGGSGLIPRPNPRFSKE